MTRAPLLSLAALALALAACGKDDEPARGAPAPPRPGTTTTTTTPPTGGPPMFGDTQPAAAPATPAEEARQIWASVCESCHGPTGRGDGPTGKMIKPPPRDHSDPAWQDATSDERIKKVIVEGGQAVDLSPVMPGRPDLAEKPAVLDELVKIIRSFRRPG